MLSKRSLVLFSAAAALLAANSTLNYPTGTQGLLLIGVRISASSIPPLIRSCRISKRPANPHDFVLSADHKTAYVPIYGDGVYGNNPHPAHEVQIVDLVARKPAGTIDVSPYLARTASRSTRPACSM
jgi:hypothetical protein